MMILNRYTVTAVPEGPKPRARTFLIPASIAVGITAVAVPLLVLAVWIVWRQMKEPNYGTLIDGSQWTYAVEYQEFSGGVQKGKAVMRVDGAETIRGKTYTKVVTVFSGIPRLDEPIIEYRRASEDGMYAINGDTEQPEYRSGPPGLSLSVGTTWTKKDLDGFEVTYRVESKETAELFDRKYENCLKISYGGTAAQGRRTIEGHQYLAPDIGLIKEVSVFKEFGAEIIKLVMTLERYDKGSSLSRFLLR